MSNVNVLTIDLEEWFHANYSDDLFDNGKTYEERVVGNTERLLDVFEKYNAKATFFTLGYIAEKYPSLLQRIVDMGHEISTHGYGHQLVYKQTPTEFEEDLKKSIYYIEKATGTSPKGYRAPSWSITKETTWVFPILHRNNIIYDASIFPVKTYLYGIPDAPKEPFKIMFKEGSIMEFPTSTYTLFNKNIPFSGGFYFRALPYRIIRSCFNKINQKRGLGVFYLHPREIDPHQPLLDNLNKRDKVIHYLNIRSCFSKLQLLLQDFKFITLESYFENHFNNSDYERIQIHHEFESRTSWISLGKQSKVFSTTQ